MKLDRRETGFERGWTGFVKRSVELSVSTI
jgi:hypothetical protein